MDYKEFIGSKGVEYTKNTVNAGDIKKIERELKVSFGNELKQYILTYGYLAYKHVELYGINSKQLIGSDMVKQTKYLHEYFPDTTDYIALENTGDGNYILVSYDDRIYEYSTEEKRLTDTGLKLFDYIFKRFQQIEED